VATAPHNKQSKRLHTPSSVEIAAEACFGAAAGYAPPMISVSCLHTKGNLKISGKHLVDKTIDED